ncbi:MAG TPA: hypothetical protein PLO47_03555 [Bacillota bacterium]|nr:hypothetical protein [Bacillota bacterium]
MVAVARKAQNRTNKARQGEFNPYESNLFKYSADSGAGAQQTPAPARGAVPVAIDRMGAPERLSAPKTGAKKYHAVSEFFADDRENDWLARQLREEKMHMVWHNFVDLGARHDMICDADMARRDYRAKSRKHQDVVDDGLSNR